MMSQPSEGMHTHSLPHTLSPPSPRNKHYYSTPIYITQELEVEGEDDLGEFSTSLPVWSAGTLLGEKNNPGQERRERRDRATYY